MTKVLRIGIILFSIMAFEVQAQQSKDDVAKVIILRGDVKLQPRKGGAVLRIKKGDWLKKGAVLSTGKRGVVKLLFKDNSRVGLAPNSSLVLKEFKENEASVLSVVKGQIRSTIAKGPLVQKKKKTKYFFRTKTAAIGVRGTDFQIIYNQENERTMLLTFSGEVLMANVAQADIGQELEQNVMENLINSDEAVLVRRGQFSAVSPDRTRASEPVRISTPQFNKLKKNEDFLFESTTTSKKKSYDSPIPPGVATKIFANTRTADDSVLEDAPQSKAPPEGFFNQKTGEYAPIAGGYIDAKTGLYISPPPGSSFDPVAQVYIPPASYGGFNPVTGGYDLPLGFKLLANGTFVLDKSLKIKLKGKAPIVITPKMLLLLRSFTSTEQLENFLENYIMRINEEVEQSELPEQLKSNSTLNYNFIIL
jgi:hypothetical protein